jgi:hypothetical protein
MLPSPLPHESQANLVVVDIREFFILRLEGSKSRDTNTDEQRLDPSGSTNTDQILQDPPETHLHTPSDDARRTVKRGLDEDNLKTRKFFR